MTARQRLPGLDLLRALAILLVVYQHGLFLFYPFINQTVGNITFSLFGFFGVEIFFVLSGFLIGTIFIESFLAKDDFGKKDIFHFWRRRWMRTLPNYYLVLLVLLLLAAFQNELPPLKEIVKFTFFSQNMVTRTSQFFLQSWSLSVEEWFYLLLPILIMAMLKLTRSKVYAVAVGIVVIIILCNVARYIGYRAGIPWGEMKLMVVFRLDSIMYGVAIALLYTRFKTWLDSVKNMLFIAGLILVLFICFVQIKFVLTAQPRELAGFFILGLTPVAFASMLPFARSLQWNQDSLPGKMVRHVSLISYSMYLNHFTIAILLGELNEPTNLMAGLTIFCLYLFITLALSTIQYNYWEKLFLRLRDKEST